MDTNRRRIIPQIESPPSCGSRRADYLVQHRLAETFRRKDELIRDQHIKSNFDMTS